MDFTVTSTGGTIGRTVEEGSGAPAPLSSPLSMLHEEKQRGPSEVTLSVDPNAGTASNALPNKPATPQSDNHAYPQWPLLPVSIDGPQALSS